MLPKPAVGAAPPLRRCSALCCTALCCGCVPVLCCAGVQNGGWRLDQYANQVAHERATAALKAFSNPSGQGLLASQIGGDGGSQAQSQDGDAMHQELLKMLLGALTPGGWRPGRAPGRQGRCAALRCAVLRWGLQDVTRTTEVRVLRRNHRRRHRRHLVMAFSDFI